MFRIKALFRSESVCVLFFSILATVFIGSCGNSVPEKNTEGFGEAISAFYVGLAAVEVGNDQRAATELEKAAALAPGEPAAWNNLGVLQLRQKDIEKAAVSLEKASELAPKEGRVFFNLAILALQKNDSESLLANLQKARELNPKDLRPLYLLAAENEKQQKDKEALASFSDILKAEPENLAALLESSRLKAKTGDQKGLSEDLAKLGEQSEGWPEPATQQFAKVKGAQLDQAATEIAFLRNVLLRLPEFRASIERIKPSDTVVGELIRRPLVMAVPDFNPAEPDIELSFGAVDESKIPANTAVVVALNERDRPVVGIGRDSVSIIGDFEIPVGADNPNQLVAFDFDYDFRSDIAFAGPSGFRLFKQKEDGGFLDATASSGLTETETTGVWAFDFDNEGDLDLLLAIPDKPPVVLRNNGNGTFERLTPFGPAKNITDFLYADLDEDGDNDAVLLESDGVVRFFSNDRGGLFRASDRINLANISAFGIGDTSGSGALELITLSSTGEVGLVSLAGLTAGSFIKLDSGFRSCLTNCRIDLADFDNNGANDLVVTDGKSSKLFLGTGGGKFVPAKAAIDVGFSGFGDIDADGKLDIVGIDNEGNAVRLINKSSKNYNWQIVKPKAAKTEGDQRVNTFGIGGEIEMRAGLAVQKQLIKSPQVHFGLGNAKKADVIRVVWQNGYVQAEFDIKSNQTIAAEQRLKGSCPHLFAWNGTEFAHVKDAPPWSPALGLKINAQDTYGILQTEEWFKIPGEALKPKDGFYELRITGEYWEAYYIDHYRLMAVDHPADTEVFTDERFSIPLPPLKVFTTNEPRPFKSAVDHNVRDASETVSRIDEKYLDNIKRGRYQGVAEDHYVELELPDDAPLDEKIWIVADGWVHPTDASINVQRGQDVERRPRSLSIEVQDENGEWRTAKENLGFPAGKMKTVLLDLDGIFAKDTKSRKLRLRTEMEIFWDKLAWAVDGPGETNLTKELEVTSANLRYRGFSVIDKPDESSPEVPDYSRILTTDQRWRDLEGYYTRFGDIKELLLKTDDRFVLANAGDEIVMKFPALPPPKEGFKRDFVIIGNGWIKDGDLNSVFSGTVLPLPTQASNDYTKPPGRLEDDPVYQKNREDWIDFHTRYVAPDRFRNALRKTDN